jgi:hypothetical protein
MDLMCVFHDSDEYGVVRWPLRELAAAAGIPLKLAKELSEKNVLKGADANSAPYIFRPKHAGVEGEPVTLVEPKDGPCWYCSRMVRDAYVRNRRGNNSRFQGQPNKAPNSTPKPPFGDDLGDGPSSSSSSSYKTERENAGETQLGLSFEKNPQITPPTLEQVKNIASMRSIAVDCAEQFFNTMMACGWVDRNQVPVRDWTFALQKYATSWRANEFQRGQHSKPGQSPKKTIYAGEPKNGF